MSFAQFLTEESIRLDLCPGWEKETEEVAEGNKTEEDAGDDPEDDHKRPTMRHVKDTVMREMAEILSASGKIQNLNKLSTDLVNVERRSTCAIGEGIVIPHVRCLQTKSLIMGFARYTPPFEFDAPDDQEVQLFIPMVAPPYDDRLYLRIYRSIAKAFLETDIKAQLLTVQERGEVIRIFNEYFNG